MDLSIIISAVIALAAGLMVGWLATKARADQIRADLIEERRELDIELSAAVSSWCRRPTGVRSVSC
ncbi:DNA recombination protein RmuC [Klebsiella aerogenes]|nr:DNA recombination protein RmuC [Klebsiella aerogenes]